MDDSLEAPSTVLPPKPENGDDEQLLEEEDDDGGLDWSKLPGVARPVIPKRGEKEFEPRLGGGSGLQTHVLDRARSAMFDVLRTPRATSSKNLSHAIWHPHIARAHVTLAKGIHFASMGHSAPRTTLGADGIARTQKRLELLPEETIYLVERGALFCWKDVGLGAGADADGEMRVEEARGAQGLEGVLGAPMSVQQVYSELVGLEDLTLERFQVFAYLKRLGYQVTRAKPPNSFYPTPLSSPDAQTAEAAPARRSNVLQRLFSIFPLLASKLSRLLFGGFDWWRPVPFSRFLHHDKNYQWLFKSLRFLPSGRNAPLYHPDALKREEAKEASPYKIFYHLYKPSTPFKKTAPPPPDFHVVVVDARTTPMPTLQELTDLFDLVPELPPPVPRRRQFKPPNQPSAQPQVTLPPSSSGGAATRIASDQPNPTRRTLLSRFLAWLPAFGSTASERERRLETDTGLPPRRPNPFLHLKTGKKMVVIAAVDAGNISFFRFAQGAFEEWPMA